VAEAFINEESQLIHGPNILNELREYLRVLIMCIHFSKKPFPNFLEATGFKSDQVLHEEGKAGVRNLRLYVEFLILDFYYL